MFYGQELDLEVAVRVLRVRMWEMGHSMEEIDDMNIEDFGDVVAYWSETSHAEKKQAEQRSRMGGR